MRDGAAVLVPTGAPHSLQNFAPAGSSVVHEPHMSASRRPHSKQNLASPGFSAALGATHHGTRVNGSPAIGWRASRIMGSPIISEGAPVGKGACRDTGGSWLGAVATLEEPPGPSSPMRATALRICDGLQTRATARSRSSTAKPARRDPPQARTRSPRWSRWRQAVRHDTVVVAFHDGKRRLWSSSAAWGDRGSGTACRHREQEMVPPFPCHGALM